MLGVLALLFSLPSAAIADTTLGVQVLHLSGQHEEPAYDIHGQANAALLEASFRSHGNGIVLEGVPLISAGHPSTSSTLYGQPTQGLSLFNAMLTRALDVRDRVWLEAGVTVINQRTPVPAIFDTITSRVSGGRYGLTLRLPAGHTQRLDTTIALMPVLHGIVRNYYTNLYFVPDRAERGSMTDGTLLYVMATRAVEYGLGYRTVNYAANFEPSGLAADHVVGSGPIAQVRFKL